MSEDKNNKTGTLLGEITLKVDMGVEIRKLLDKIDEDENFKNYIYSACDNYEQNTPATNQKEHIMLAILCGWVINNIYNKAIKEEIQKKLEDYGDMQDYECDLEDGRKFVISTDDVSVVNNELHKKVFELTGSKPISTFRKVSKEKSEILREKVIKHLQEKKSV